jgi:hypothetical protein
MMAIVHSHQPIHVHGHGPNDLTYFAPLDLTPTDDLDLDLDISLNCQRDPVLVLVRVLCTPPSPPTHWRSGLT